jgi:hypothetical protein
LQVKDDVLEKFWANQVSSCSSQHCCTTSPSQCLQVTLSHLWRAAMASHCLLDPSMRVLFREHESERNQIIQVETFVLHCWWCRVSVSRMHSRRISRTLELNFNGRRPVGHPRTNLLKKSRKVSLGR